MKEYEPHLLLHNCHLMTLVASLWPRRFPRLPKGHERLFEVEPGSQVLAVCHWQPEPQRHPTLVLVHGLEGCIRSSYMLGTAEKACAAGFNVVRVNQRNCGGTEHLTPTLYHSGMSGDLRAVVLELVERDALPAVFLAGFSMGGNLALKMAGEMGLAAPRQLRAACGVSPAVQLAVCADALARPENCFYEWYFVRSLKRRLRRKARLFPGRYSLDGLARVRTLREFDNLITAPHSGFRDADDYYARASAIRVIAQIRVPTLILTAQDDPFVPFEPFQDAAVTSNSHITLLALPFGGHCAFLARSSGDARYWAESRIVEFCREQLA